MNEVSNSFRLVPRAEVERDHLFKTTRHFPQLRNSLRSMQRTQLSLGRDMITTRRFSGTEKKKRPVQLKSTHRLDKLTGSCLDDLKAMNGMRTVLLNERSRARNERAQERKLIVDEDHKLTPLERANKKLTKLSVTFDSQSANNDLSGFQGAPLTVDELAVQLSRCLNINLHRDELEAVFKTMDLDDSGDIDGVEFTRYFFKLGSDHVAKMRKDEYDRLQAEIAADKAAKLAEEIRRKEWEDAQIGQFTSEDATTAMDKLSTRAYYFDNNHFIDMLLIRDFDCYLSPYQFLSQLQESFDLHMSKAEYGALVDHFTSRPETLHCIDGERFINVFHNLQRTEREKYKRLAEEKKILRKRVNEMGQFTEVFANLGR